MTAHKQTWATSVEKTDVISLIHPCLTRTGFWGSEWLVSTLSNTRNRCVPGTGWMVTVHLDSTVLDRRDEYSFITEWPSSIQRGPSSLTAAGPQVGPPRERPFQNAGQSAPDRANISSPYKECRTHYAMRSTAGFSSSEEKRMGVNQRVLMWIYFSRGRITQCSLKSSNEREDNRSSIRDMLNALNENLSSIIHNLIKKRYFEKCLIEWKSMGFNVIAYHILRNIFFVFCRTQDDMRMNKWFSHLDELSL